MARHYRKKDRKVVIEFRPSERATAHGGQTAVNALANEFGLWERIAREPALDRRAHKGKGYDPAVYIAALIFNFTNGGGSLADAERLDDDEALKCLLGIKKFPDQSAVGEWLRGVGDEGLEALRRIIREFVRWSLDRAEAGRLLHCGQLEAFFDDTQIEVDGKRFEGAKLNYEGKVALSWQTLWVGPFLADATLGSPSAVKEPLSSAEAGNDVSSQLPRMLEQNAHLWKDRASYLYADSASSAGKYLESIDRHFDHWSVSYNKWTSPLERAAEELPPMAWSGAQTLRWRDGSDHTARHAWVRHQPEGCAKPKLFAVTRHKKSEGELFWRHAFIACDERGSTPLSAIERHRLKGDKERAFSDLLSDFDLHHPPCMSLRANEVFYLLGALAFNLLQALKLIYLPAEDQPRRIRTLLHHLLLIPVEIKRHARQLKACFYAPAGWVCWWRCFLEELLSKNRFYRSRAPA